MVHAIIVAAGASRRAPGAVKKQFVELLGCPVIFHTLTPFQASPVVDTIVCVIAKEDLSSFHDLRKRYPMSKIEAVVEGGASRQESVAAGLFFLEKKYAVNDGVMVHDGVRPLVTPELIKKVADAALSHSSAGGTSVVGGAITAIPVTDSLKEVRDHRIERSVHRESIWAAQTPQVFRLGFLIEAMKKAAADRFVGTDEAALVERIGYPVLCVEGFSDNIKITTVSDLKRAETLLELGRG